MTFMSTNNDTLANTIGGNKIQQTKIHFCRLQSEINFRNYTGRFDSLMVLEGSKEQTEQK